MSAGQASKKEQPRLTAPRKSAITPSKVVKRKPTLGNFRDANGMRPNSDTPAQKPTPPQAKINAPAGNNLPTFATPPSHPAYTNLEAYNRGRMAAFRASGMLPPQTPPQWSPLTPKSGNSKPGSGGKLNAPTPSPLTDPASKKRVGSGGAGSKPPTNAPTPSPLSDPFNIKRTVPAVANNSPLAPPPNTPVDPSSKTRALPAGSSNHLQPPAPRAPSNTMTKSRTPIPIPAVKEGDRVIALGLAHARATETDPKELKIINTVIQAVGAAINELLYEVGMSPKDVGDGLRLCIQRVWDEVVKENPDFPRQEAEAEEMAQRKIQEAEFRAKLERTRKWVDGTMREKRGVRQKGEVEGSAGRGKDAVDEEEEEDAMDVDS